MLIRFLLKSHSRRSSKISSTPHPASLLSKCYQRIHIFISKIFRHFRNGFGFNNFKRWMNWNRSDACGISRSASSIAFKMSSPRLPTPYFYYSFNKSLRNSSLTSIVSLTLSKVVHLKFPMLLHR